MFAKNMITPDTVILVSGGARGITAQCVIKLAQFVPCKFILLGRTPINEQLPEWAQNCPDDGDLKLRCMNQLTVDGKKATPLVVERQFRSIRAQQEVENTLHSIRSTGSIVEYLNLDITEPVNELQEAIIGSVQRLGKITGMIHGAGALSDRRIEKKTSLDFEIVFTPKVRGLHNLLRIIPASQLDFLVLFSSVVGFFGNIGQSDYAMANEVLNKAAHQLKMENPTCHVISINWGPWDSGMVTPELKRAFTERGMDVISTEAGAELLVKEIANTHHVKDLPVQIVVGHLPTRAASDISGDLRKFEIHRSMTLEANPFLLDHKIGLNPVLPATCAASWIISGCEQLYPGYSFHQLEDYKILKGIIFDENLASEHTLELSEREKIPGSKVKLDARIWSKNKNGRPIYHYSMNVTLQREKLPATIHNINPSPGSLLTNSIPGKTLYEDGTLFHGPSFQGVQRVINLSQDQVVLECLLRAIPSDQQGQFPVFSYNSFVYDAIVQSLLIWSQHNYQAPCLPSSLIKLEQFQPVPFDLKCLVDLKIISHNQTTAVVDIIVTNTQGEVLTTVTGLQGTISPALKRLIRGDPTPKKIAEK